MNCLELGGTEKVNFLFILLIPDDHNRVCLRGTRDDYINASFIKDVVPTSPCFIATQAPLQPSLNDFWLMVYEQQASIIVMLLSKPATGKVSSEAQDFAENIFDKYFGVCRRKNCNLRKYINLTFLTNLKIMMSMSSSLFMFHFHPDWVILYYGR